MVSLLVHLRVPRLDKTIENPPEGEVALYLAMFRLRVQLPLHLFLQSFFGFDPACTPQLLLNWWCHLISTYSLWQIYGDGAPMSIPTFISLYQINDSVQYVDFFYYIIACKKALVGTVSSFKDWKERWFFASGNWLPTDVVGMSYVVPLFGTAFFIYFLTPL